MRNKKDPDPNIVIDTPEPMDPEILERHIAELAEGFKVLDRSGLKRKTIILLLHDATKVPKRDIERILNAAPRLKELYCK